MSTRRIGLYEVVQELGRGGMGVVYLARQPQLDRLVALKVLPFADEKMAARLQREAKLLAELNNPNIIPIFDIGEENGSPFFAMAYCGGGTVADIVKQTGALDPGQVVTVVAAVADALSSIHAIGLVHRDVKPSNVLLSTEGRPFLSDLGIAGGDGASRMTTSGAVLGTVGYSAPELLGGADPTPAADVFSLGATAYELLTGRAPFAAAHISGVLDAVRRGDRVPLAVAAPAAPPALVALVNAAMSLDPAARPSDLEAFAHEVRSTAKPVRLSPQARDTSSASTGASAAVVADPSGPVAGPESATVVSSRPRSPEPPPPPASGSIAVVATAQVERKRPALLVVAAVVAALVGAGLVWLVNRPSGAVAKASATVTLPSKTAADGVTFTTTWDVLEDGRVRGTSALTNTSGIEVMHAHDEVIPKDLVATASDLEVSPALSSVVDEDPIVRFCLQLGPGESTEVTWNGPLATATPDDALLNTWAVEWSAAYDEHVANPGGEPCPEIEVISTDSTPGTDPTATTIDPTATTVDPSTGTTIDPSTQTTLKATTTTKPTTTTEKSTTTTSTTTTTTVVKPPTVSKPSAPTGVSLSVGFTSSNAITVTWTAPSNNGGAVISGYAVTLSGGGYNQTKSVGVTTATFESVPYGAAMSATVAAKNSAGDGPTASGNATSGAAAKPANVAASALNASTVRVTFALTRAIPGTTCAVLLNGSSFAVPCTGGDIPGLAGGTTYSVVARASGPSGVQDTSGGSVATPVPPDNCPSGDSSGNGFDGSCGVAPSASPRTNGAKGGSCNVYVMTHNASAGTLPLVAAQVSFAGRTGWSMSGPPSLTITVTIQTSVPANDQWVGQYRVQNSAGVWSNWASWTIVRNAVGC